MGVPSIFCSLFCKNCLKNKKSTRAPIQFSQESIRSWPAERVLATVCGHSGRAYPPCPVQPWSVQGDHFLSGHAEKEPKHGSSASDPHTPSFLLSSQSRQHPLCSGSMTQIPRKLTPLEAAAHLKDSKNQAQKDKDLTHRHAKHISRTLPK